MEFIKWTELSLFLSGNNNSIRANKIPKKYESKVNSLVELINSWKNESK